MHELPPPADAPEGSPPMLVHLIEADCEEPLPGRAPADLGEAAAARLDAYDAQTAPLIERLRSGAGGAEVLDVTFGETAEATWAAIEAAVGLEPIAGSLEAELTAAKKGAAAERARKAM